MEAHTHSPRRREPRLPWRIGLRGVLGLALVVASSAVLTPADPTRAAPPAAAAADCGTEQPDLARAQAMAAACGQQVEALSRRDEVTRVLANPGGTVTVETALGPVRYRAGDQWVPVDLTMERKPDGSVGPKAHPRGLRLAGARAAAHGALATVTAEGRTVGLGWVGALPEPELAGNRATWREVKPGVDLVVEALRTGFEQFVVVKNRAAVAEVATIRLPAVTGGGGAPPAKGGDGALTLLPPTETRAAVRIPAPMMWDAAVGAGSGDPARPAAVATRVDEGTYVLEPSQAYLNDPARQFPITIDPAVVVSHKRVFDTTAHTGYLNTDLSTRPELQMGHVHDAAEGREFTARSYLQFPSSQVAGALVRRATLSLYEIHSWSCEPAEWWAEVTAGVSTATRWANQPAWSRPHTRGVSTQTRGYGPSCADGWVTVDAQKIFQEAANARWSGVTIGLRAANENSYLGWKRFASGEGANPPKVEVEFNHLPGAPGQLSVEGSTRCGSGEVGRRYVTTPTPTFTGLLADQNTGQNLRAQLQILRGGTVFHTQDDDQAIPSKQRARLTLSKPLAAGVAYTYRMRTFDGFNYGTYSGACELLLDNNPPDEPPRVDVGVVRAGIASAVTFRPGPGDAGEINSYEYGFDRDALDTTVAAGPDGSATVPLTLRSDETPTLYVRALNRTGMSAEGAIADATIWPTDSDPPPAPRSDNDFNGDGRADVFTTVDLGGDRTQFHVQVSRPDGTLFAPIVIMDSMTYPLNAIHWTTGDFDGDRRADVVILKDRGDGSSTVSVLLAHGNGVRDYQAWDSGPGLSWFKPRSKLAVGNFDGDAQGRDDLAVLYDEGTTWENRVFLSESSPDMPLFAQPEVWFTGVSATAGPWTETSILAGDVIGDDKDDFVRVKHTASCDMSLWFHVSGGEGFGYDGSRYGNIGGWCWDRTKAVMGDFDGNGRDDFAALYRTPTCQAHLYSMLTSADGTGIAAPALHWASGQWAWCGELMDVSVGAVNADERADLSHVYRCCGAYQARVWRSVAQPTGALPYPGLAWQGVIGPAGVGGVSVDPARRYELVNVNSGRCLTVTGASTADRAPLMQHACDPTAAHKTWHVVPHGGGQVQLKVGHAPGKCADVPGSSTANNVILQLWTCAGGTGQSWQLSYVSGLARPYVVLKLMYSNKCADVVNASVADNAQVMQFDCHGAPNQLFHLRPVG
ncbi:MAG TPA: RICIN domain-containing protein [Pilimelia sp.]|nr:RICIN domain-containing protein [Pilimelia sp.]